MNNQWNVLCSGRSILDVEQRDLEGPPHQSVYVNSAVQCDDLKADYWAIRDTAGFVNNIDYRNNLTLIIPQSWNKKVGNENNVLYNERRQYERTDKILIPKRRKFYEIVYNDPKGNYAYTFLQAITFAIVRGAKVINTYGIDVRGKGIDGRQMGSTEAKRIERTYQDLKRTCKNQTRDIEFVDHGYYSDGI